MLPSVFLIFSFQPDSQTVVGIRFLANPVPEANEVIWHHSPPVSEEGAPPPPGEFNLESGMVSQTFFLIFAAGAIQKLR